MGAQAACLVKGSSQHSHRHHRRAIFNIIVGFIITIFSGGGVRRG